MKKHWLLQYQPQWFGGDLRSAVFATLLLIPQSLAYAALAGLPPHIGLYASMLPAIAYALFGSSPVLSVGPVAILGLMTASALTPLALDSSQYIQAASLLAILSGIFLLAFGTLRLGALAHLLSHPVISGFISGAAVLIIIGQLRPLLGIHASGDNALHLLGNIGSQLQSALPLTTAIGISTLLLLAVARLWLPGWLKRLGLSTQTAVLLARSLPMMLVMAGGLLTGLMHWQHQIAVVGTVPSGLPMPSLPLQALPLLSSLLLPALFIALIGFVESIAIASTMAARSKQTINPDRELFGLGAANIGSALSGGLPVTGSFARTAITVEGGARSALSGILAALMVGMVLLWGSSLFAWLPLTVLAATIIVAVAALIDVDALKRAWQQDKLDAAALLGTFAGVLLFGVEPGIAIGIGLSLFTVIWRASHPHIAVIGRLPGTSHYRNVLHYPVETQDSLLMLRIDEDLFFGNAQLIEQRILQEWQKKPQAKHIVLMMSSVSHIDTTALEMLERLDSDIRTQGGKLHLAELKAFLLKPLERGHFLQQLSGQVFLTAAEAEQQLRSAL